MTNLMTVLKATAITALCVIAPSAQASVTDRVSLEVRPAAKFQVVDSGEGFQTLLVATNAPFDISIEGIIGEVSVDLSTSGQVRGRSYGASAQTPGAIETTTQVASPFGGVIYESQYATAAQSGSVWDQAVQLTVNYDPLADPRISVEARD